MAKCVLCSVKQNNSGLVSDLCSTECLPYPSVEVVEFAPSKRATMKLNTIAILCLNAAYLWIISHYLASSGKYCSAVDAEDDCTYYYSYAYDPVTSEVRVKAQKVKSCALLGGAGGWWLGGGIVVLILILGLLAFLCLWCFRERQARQEYAKFNEDKSTAKWDRVRLASGVIFSPNFIAIKATLSSSDNTQNWRNWCGNCTRYAFCLLFCRLRTRCTGVHTRPSIIPFMSQIKRKNIISCAKLQQLERKNYCTFLERAICLFLYPQEVLLRVKVIKVERIVYD